MFLSDQILVKLKEQITADHEWKRILIEESNHACSRDYSQAQQCNHKVGFRVILMCHLS